VIKYTGDGWLINITDTDKLTNLLAFSVALKVKFDIEIRRLTDINFPEKWDLRLAVSSGNDIKLKVNDNIDFIGDSIRRSVRISNLCLNNEILVDSSIYRDSQRDFSYHEKQIEIGNNKFEHDIGEGLYTLSEAKYSKLKNADILLKHFDVLGQIREKESVVSQITSELTKPELSVIDKIQIDKVSIALVEIGDTRNQTNYIMILNLKDIEESLFSGPN